MPKTELTVQDLPAQLVADIVKQSVVPALLEIDAFAREHYYTKGRLLTKKDVASYLNVSVRTVDTLVAEGALTPVHVRSARRFTRDSVDRYISGLPARRK